MLESFNSEISFIFTYHIQTGCTKDAAINNSNDDNCQLKRLFTTQVRIDPPNSRTKAPSSNVNLSSLEQQKSWERFRKFAKERNVDVPKVDIELPIGCISSFCNILHQPLIRYHEFQVFDVFS